MPWMKYLMMIKPKNFHVRLAMKTDWKILKSLRLEALLDSPHAFTATYEKTKTHSDSEWQDRAAQRTPCHFLLAFDVKDAVGMVGGIVDEQNEFNVVAMWVKPVYRASGVAALLISSVKQLANSKVTTHWYYELLMTI